MSDIHDFDNTVIAILDHDPAVRSATEGLMEAGYEFEVLSGEDGRRHIDSGGEEGLIATVKRLVAAFGDQYRIMDRLDDALAEGKTVISVEMDDDDPAEAIGILRDHGGSYIWKLGEWTFTPISE